MKPLDITTIDLQGRHLIEASAGTGKTWTLTGLYLRLLLETEVQVEDILVVTFTEAATEELRGKLRERLVDGLLAFCGHSSEDEFLQSLVARYQSDEAQRKLLRAIRSFDNAPVYTIHGFCRRLLNETALESGIAFDNELLKDDSELRLEAVYDFFRRHLEDGWPWLNEWTPEILSDQLRHWLGKPDLPLLGCQPPIDEQTALQAVQQAHEAAAAIWHGCEPEIRQLLATHPALNRRSYSKSNLPRWLAIVGENLVNGDPVLVPECLQRFTPAELQAKCKGEPPRHEWFECLSRWQETHDLWLKAREWARAAWRCRALREVRRNMENSKHQLGVLTFDDLLLRLDQALQGSHGESLAQWARSRYPVALIDEFQDTDPTQYRIFQAIYGGHGQSLFFVGDPKQAIYSFRGADLYAYLQARRETPDVQTLAVNWRSSRPLVSALNQLFTRHPLPFRLEAVSYIEVEAAQAGDPPPLDYPPLRIWTLAGEKPWNKGEAGERIVSAVADDIASLLGSGELKGSDIANLERKNAQAVQMRQALAARGIASVLKTDDSVFATPQADDLLRVLEAVAWLHDEERLRAALVTDLIGLTGDDLLQLEEQPDGWEGWVECFQHWQQLWRKQGVMAMFQAILVRQQVHGRFLNRLDGERCLTNWLHLAELLHRQHLQQNWGMEGLIRWFQRLIREEIRLPDDAELRLESDAQLVQIVTIHRSKGLEYEIVYCPFLWDGGDDKRIKPPFLFHDPGQGYQAHLELGSPDWRQHKKLAWEEQQAEELRLAYVALTRARRHCTLVTGWIKSVNQSPIGWLLHGEKLVREDFTWQQMAEDLQALENACEGNLRSIPLPEPKTRGAASSTAPEKTGKARRFPGTIPQPWQVTSYSGLVSGQAHEQPDYDQLFPREPEDEDRIFPIGPKAGVCLHAILEHLDFTQPVAKQWHKVLTPALSRGGFHAIEPEPLCSWLQGVLATPLEEGDFFCLQQLPNGDRIDEMAFYLPMGEIQADRLRALLSDHLPSPTLRRAAARLNASTVQGYLKGFVDLIFRRGGRYWVVDYKSNYLAASPAGYTEEAMTEAVAQAHYYLQYLLYTVALHRFLKLRLKDYDYDEHFGGVYYLFLRGMTPQTGPQCGIYRDRPSRAMIEALEQWLT